MLNFNEKQLEEVCDDFFNLTKLKIVLYDSEFRPVYSSKTFAPFCALLRSDRHLRASALSATDTALTSARSKTSL